MNYEINEDLERVMKGEFFKSLIKSAEIEASKILDIDEKDDDAFEQAVADSIASVVNFVALFVVGSIAYTNSEMVKDHLMKDLTYCLKINFEAKQFMGSKSVN